MRSGGRKMKTTARLNTAGGILCKGTAERHPVFDQKRRWTIQPGRLDILPLTVIYARPDLQRFWCSQRYYGTVPQLWCGKEINAVTDHFANRPAILFNQQENVYMAWRWKDKSNRHHAVSTSRCRMDSPSTAEVYDMLASLKQYILSVNGKETNPPMLNVYKEDSTRYNVMVAASHCGITACHWNFKPKRMVPGYILVGDVKGGIAVIKKRKRKCIITWLIMAKVHRPSRFSRCSPTGSRNQTTASGLHGSITHDVIPYFKRMISAASLFLQAQSGMTIDGDGSDMSYLAHVTAIPVEQAHIKIPLPLLISGVSAAASGDLPAHCFS